MNPVLFEMWRGSVLESIHRGRYAVVDRRGRWIARRGDVDAIMFMRSAAKPFQALTVVESGAAERYRLTDEELAVIAGSHHGDRIHVRAVSSILRKAGVRMDALQCGVHVPHSSRASRLLFRSRREPSVLHNNCSGKHAGMLAAARRLKAPRGSYLDNDHPVQRSNRRIIARYSGVRESSIRTAVDGCSAPTFGLPVRSIAAAFASLAAEADNPVTRAMMTHPEMVGHPCQEIMTAAPGRVFGKVGAEGVYGLGIPQGGIGIAIKMDDGNPRGLLSVVAAIVDKHRLLEARDRSALAKAVRGEVRNHAGIVVGSTRAVV